MGNLSNITNRFSASFCKHAKAKKIIIPGMLIFFSVSLTFILLELFFPYLVLLLPLKTHWHLDKRLQVLAQYSKSNAMPEKYIALVGDSYAAGKGDWFLTVFRNARPAFHSAHIINNRTGKNVVTFGGSGAGSVGGLVKKPLSRYQWINDSPRLELKPPESIIVYFYEGNDLNNNLSQIRRNYKKKYDYDRIYDVEYFNNYLLKMMQSDFAEEQEQIKNLADNFFFAKFITHTIKDLIKKDKIIARRYGKHPEILFGNVNQVLIDGKKINIPDKLQSPALELTSDEIDLSIYVFEQSLIYLQKYFSSSKIGVVYIPSPLSSYQLSSDKVDIQTYEKRNRVYDSDFVRKRSNKISSLIEGIAENNNIHFIDSREYIWKSSSKNIIHGPTDWKHFNKEGYAALSEAVIELIRKMEKNSLI